MKTICWFTPKPNGDKIVGWRFLWLDWFYSLATQLAGEEAGQWRHADRLLQSKLFVDWLTDGRYL